MDKCLDRTKSGTSNSYLKAAHIIRASKSHEIASLQQKAFELFESALPIISFELWQYVAIKSPMFQLWNLILQTEITLESLFLFFFLGHQNTVDSFQKIYMIQIK